MVVRGPRQVIADAWCRLLDVEGVAASDDFFSLGGDSMLALSLIDEVESELGFSFPLEVLFRESSYGALVEACERLGGSDRTEDGADAAEGWA